MNTSDAAKYPADFRIRDEGTLILFDPQTERAREWWDACVEDGYTVGPYRVVEHRMAQAILIGIQYDGFTFEVED